MTIPVGNITGLNGSNYKLPVVYQYSVGVQRATTARSVLNGTYVGNQSGIRTTIRNRISRCQLVNWHGSGSNSRSLQPECSLPRIPLLRLSQNEANGHYNSLASQLERTDDTRSAAELWLHTVQAIVLHTGNSAGRILTMSRIRTLAGGTTLVRRL